MADRKDAATQRAEGRQRRRAGRGHDAENGSAEESERTTDDVFDARDAAKKAAAAAAVGAAVGAMRAFAARTDDHEESDPPESAAGEVDEDVEQAPAAAEANAGDEREVEDEVDEEDARKPEPAEPEARVQRAAPDRKPQRGGTPDQLRSATQRAREVIEELQGNAPESVSSLERTPDGWAVTVEVVEVRRVPESTDVLASYRVELDEDQNLIRYERCGRYYRAQSDVGGDQ
jgi:hypothetical protein